MADKKEDSKKVYVVKDKYEEIRGIYETESEANQLAAYLNGRFLESQPDIASGVHKVKYFVRNYTVKEFYRKKKLFWLMILYFDKYPSKTGKPYTICNIEKNMIIDHEIEDTVNFIGYTNHIYFTVPIRATKKEIEDIASEKFDRLCEKGISDGKNLRF